MQSYGNNMADKRKERNGMIRRIHEMGGMEYIGRMGWIKEIKWTEQNEEMRRIKN